MTTKKAAAPSPKFNFKVSPVESVFEVEVDGSGVNRLYLLGIECTPVKTLEIAVKSSLDPKKLCDIDEEIPLPDEMIQDLVMQVLQLGRFIMLMPKEVTEQGVMPQCLCLVLISSALVPVC